MIDFKAFIESITEEVGKYANQDIVSFLEDNDWFHNRPEIVDGIVWLTDEQQHLYKAPLIRYLKGAEQPKNEALLSMLSDKFPFTAERLEKFYYSINATQETQYYVTDFLLYSLEKDIFLMNDKEISIMVEKAVNDLIKAHGETLTFFLSWLRTNYKTTYKNEYIMTNRYSMDFQKEAYDVDEYLELMYYLYNEDYIAENEMYSKAAESKNYADTWLFLALHFICSIRVTDMERIPHPILTNEPENIIKSIQTSTFSDKEARETLLSITYRLCLLPLTPSKTSEHSNISAIKFNVPESCEVHIGTLFALCEAHRCIAEIANDEPLIRRINDYDRISRYMGDEIGSLFLESNFRSRSANKSYLQAVYTLSDDILESNYDRPSVKGYILAALARSHKGSYGEFAHTTATYLKDAKFTGLTPEFVAMELFERGVLSFIPSMLLKMITEGEYNKLEVSKQTQLIQTLDLTPAEIENAVSITNQAQKRAEAVVKELVTETEDTILDILHRIGSGSAFSKQPECLCLLSALKKICPYDDRRQCVGCQYEISTKSTLYLLISEYNRMYQLYNSVEDPMEKEKYKKLLMQVILPEFDELLVCIKEQYGEDIFKDYEEIIRENTQ